MRPSLFVPFGFRLNALLTSLPTFLLAVLLTVLLLVALPGCQSKEAPVAIVPPAAAVQTLRTLYPRAPTDSARWQWDQNGYFEAHFALDGLPHKLRTDSSGRYLETEINIARLALPVPVQDSLQAEVDHVRDSKLFRIRRVSIVHYADGHTEYEAQVRAAGKWRKRYYDEKGNLLRQTKAKKG